MLERRYHKFNTVRQIARKDNKFTFLDVYRRTVRERGLGKLGFSILLLLPCNYTARIDKLDTTGAFWYTSVVDATYG